MEKCSSEKLFLFELGKFEDKFQVNRINKTQNMKELVDPMFSWTVCENAKFTCSKWKRLKI